MLSAEPRSLLGIDTGGTFIDLVLCTPDGRMRFHKELGDPANLPASVFRGISSLARELGIGAPELLADVALIAHGTTIATNAILTRTGAPTALLTTAGLRDTLEMRRGVKEEVFNLRYRAPEPLVPRKHRFGVEERIGYDGAVLKELNPDAALAQVGQAIHDDGLSSVAICLMHAWKNAAHEKSLAASVQAEWPSLDIIASHDILPQAGFYDRLSTTVMTAYAVPLMRKYLQSLERLLSEGGFRGTLFVISSSGGLMTGKDAIAQAARTVLSGPAAAPVFGVYLCKSAGYADAVVVDMGGTSFDVSLVANAAPSYASGGEIGGLRVAFPMTEVHTIALGGGSIGWIDGGGLLQLGPQSAGATPGPACYGRGGKRPTITDADVVLGYLDPRQFERSALRIDRALAEKALSAEIGKSSDPSQAAIDIYRLAATKMADAVQRAALEVGVDYRNVPLVVAGGAGPLHACAIGREIGVRMLIVPAGAAAMCAIGALLLRPQYDVVQSLFAPLDAVLTDEIQDICGKLVARIVEICQRRPDELDTFYAADLRYVGQEQEIKTEFSLPDLRTKGIAALREAFQSAHRQRRGYVLEDAEIEILNVRLTAAWDIGQTLSLGAEPVMPGGSPYTRLAYDGSENRYREFSVTSWASLRPGESVAAPAIIEMTGTSCVVIAPYRCTIDPDRNLVLTAV